MLNRCGQVGWAAVLFGLALSGLCSGAEGVRVGVPLPVVANTNRIEMLHDLWSDRIDRLVDRCDRFFADRQLDDSIADSRVKLGLGVKYDPDSRWNLETRSSVRLAVPALENRLSVILDTDSDANADETPSAVVETWEWNRIDTGLRYWLLNRKHFRLRADAGFRPSSGAQVFGKLGGIYEEPFENWDLRIAETLRYYSKDRFSEITEMRWSRKLAKGWMFRSTSAATWAEIEDGVTLEKDFRLFFQLDDRNAFRAGINGTWPEVPATVEAIYAADIAWRRRFFSDWAFIEISPGVEWAQARDYEPGMRFSAVVDVVL